MSLRTDGPISNRAGNGPATLLKQWASKAWANLNGLGTIAVRGSQNISSTFDNGVGDYSFNLSSAMASTSAVSLLASGSRNGSYDENTTPINASPTVSAYRVINVTGTATFADTGYVFSALHGDLA